MKPDYVMTLDDLPKRHAGLLFEQLHQAALSAAVYMRAVGLTLPGSVCAPTHNEIYMHLWSLTNDAMEEYIQAQGAAPNGQHANEIWGEASDEIFSLELTGVSQRPGDGFEVSIDFNLLYGR